MDLHYHFNPGFSIVGKVPWHWADIEKSLSFFKNNQYNRRFDDCSRRFDARTIIASTVIQHVNSTLVQSSIWCLHNCWIDACAIVESTLVCLSNQHLCNRRFDACAIADSTLVKKSLFCFVLKKNLFRKNFFRNFTHWYFCKYSKGDGFTKQNLNFKLDQIDFIPSTKV